MFPRAVCDVKEHFESVGSLDLDSLVIVWLL